MSLSQIREASAVLFHLRAEEGDVIFTDLFPDDHSDEDLARLWVVVDEWRKTVDQLAQIVGDEWVQRWRNRDRKALEVDGFLVTTKKGSKYTECNNSEGFWEAAMRDPEEIPKWFNPNTVRVGAIPQAVRDTFFDEGYRIKPDAVRQATAIPVQAIEDARQKKELSRG